MTTAPPNLPEELRARLGRVKQWVVPSQGDAARVALVEAEGGRFAVKWVRDAFGVSWLHREHDALVALVETGLPAPRAHAFVERQGPAGPARMEAWLLMDWLPGVTVEAALAHAREAGDTDGRSAVLRAFGDALRRIHETPVPAALRAREPWLDGMLREAEENLVAGRADEQGTAALLERLRKERPEPVQPTLIHGDFTVDNVLVEEGKVTGVIDWSGAVEGDPRYDLALATRPKRVGFRSAADVKAFYDGYGGEPLSKEARAYFVWLYEFF